MVPFKARPRGGNSTGGYLNGVTGRIDSITFKAGKEGTTQKGGTWRMYTGVVNITADGATESKPQFLDAGFLYGNNVVSKDGTRIDGTDIYSLDPNSSFGRFIFSMLEGEGRETGNFLADEHFGDGRSYEGLAGARVVFERRRDTEGTIAAGARKLKIKTVDDSNRERCAEAGKRPDRTDKSKKYWLDNLLVADVVAGPEPKKGGGKKVAAKAAALTAATTEDVTGLADAVLVDTLTKESPVAVSQLPNKALRYAVANGHGANHPVRTFIVTDEYLQGAVERNLIVLEGSGKSASVSLTA